MSKRLRNTGNPRTEGNHDRFGDTPSASKLTFESVESKDGQLTAKFSAPIPLLGIKGQELGVVRRCLLSLPDHSVTTYRLETKWQSVELDAKVVRFDAEAGVLKMGAR